MSKKARTVSNKAGKLMKCDGQMLKKVVEAKGYKLHELSKMLRYCSDYLTTCCRTNQISDVAAKYLMDYKIFPQMYDLEGEIKVGSPNENETKTSEEHVRGEIDKDDCDEAARDRLKKRMDMINANSTYGIPKADEQIEFVTPYGIVRSEKNLRNCIKQAIGPKSPNWGTNLIGVRDMLENACFNGMPYNLEDMRNDLLAFAANVDKYPEKWVDFVKRMSLQYEPDCRRSPFAPTAQEIKKVLNEKSGRAVSSVISESKENLYPDGSDMLSLGLKHFFKGMLREAKNDPEIKAMIKQAVKEAYEEL